MAQQIDKSPQPITMQLWIKGCNSILHPAQLSEGQYHWAENCTSIGGMMQTRPGFRLVASIPGVNLQGFTIFTPKLSDARLVVAVDGQIFAGQAPDFDFVKIEGLKFSAEADIITFQSTVQSATRVEGIISLIDPTPILIIQDGINSAGIWDGASARHMRQNSPFNETKTGLWMAWIASRLWVARDNLVFASDQANPLSFSEEFLATRSGFEMPSFVTGMVETADQRGLLVFTDTTTTSILANIRDRAQWGQTQDFQRLLFKSIGCVAGLTACNQFGLTYWFSASGLVSLDAALYSQRTAMVQSLDAEMTRSKRNLSPLLSQACATSFDNMLLVSVPSGSKYNRETWVLNQSPIQSGGGTPSAWTGIWTGVAPVQWASGSIAGRRKLLFASRDKTAANDTNIHIWEAMRRDRQDAGSVKCQFTTAAITSDTLIKFHFARFEVAELLGEVDLRVFVAGSRGKWMQIGNYQLAAEIGSLGAPGQRILNLGTIMQAYRPQTRTLETNNLAGANYEATPEMNKIPGIDKSFMLLFEWTGRMGISKVTFFYSNEDEAPNGKCAISEEGKVNAVNEFGEKITAS